MIHVDLIGSISGIPDGWDSMRETVRRPELNLVSVQIRSGSDFQRSDRSLIACIRDDVRANAMVVTNLRGVEAECGRLCACRCLGIVRWPYVIKLPVDGRGKGR